MAANAESEAYLLRRLREAPREHDYIYTEEARLSLLQDLFSSLACNKREYLHLFFPNGEPRFGNADLWNLSAAQGAKEGAEYGHAARGKPCGHIFKNGEATYRCKTCSLDDTCVLCSKCFESSDHTNHAVFISISSGNCGCCDCGDAEAWIRPVKCAIHTPVNNAESSSMNAETTSQELPEELVRAIRTTIGRAIDYMCDVISCSPEQLRLPKTEEAIRQDEQDSRLNSRYFESESSSDPSGDDKPQYALVLWNDEKHTINEVEEQVARACKKKKEFGKERAQETDFIGRSILIYSSDIQELLEKSKIIEHIKVTVTIRSARDTYREQMCGTIIEWLCDIAGCSVGGNNDILRTTICEELLGIWRRGSKAWNTKVGQRGIDDHAHDEEIVTTTIGRRLGIPVQVVVATAGGEEMEVDTLVVADAIEMENEDDDDDDVDMVGSGNDVQNEEDPSGGMSIAEQLLHRYLGPPDTNRGQPSANPVPEEQPERTITGDMKVPATPGVTRRPGPPPPNHWLEKPEGYINQQPLPPYEDLRQRVRLDWLIMFDLRLWKKARVDLRELYISTVVAIPEFKRILGLRFAGLYTILSQLYLIADREPDHSIINLSLQMLTTPSITAEVVRRGNFLTNLMAILYTFLTTRQVGYPYEVNKEANLAFDAGNLTNRRTLHFFQDMKYLFGSEYVQDRLRKEEKYMLQFLDLVKLHQGICPNIRAVTEHVEYEAEAWISASLITREITKLARQFSEAYKSNDEASLRRAIAMAARQAIINSMGWERERFQQSEIKSEVEFKQLGGFVFDTDRWSNHCFYKVVKASVDKQFISFHHALHYTLSWLIETGKNMSVQQLQKLLLLEWEQVKDDAGPGAKEEYELEDLAIAMFDYPLRVCVWLAQIKAGMWVRNGFSLRHQMQTYKGVSHRDLTHNRDIFLLQTALVVINPSRMLVTMTDRFNLIHWMQGNYDTPEGYEETQVLDLVEDFLHLLIVLLSDRLPLIPLEEEPNLHLLKLQRELIHILCFKPIQFSELCARLPERSQDQEGFQEILSDMTNFRPPDGLSDSGTFELKDKYQDEVDPYIMQFSKNQREEMENMYRTRIAKRTGQSEAEVVFEMQLRPIRTGLFKEIAAFTKTPIFAQIIYYSLAYALQFKTFTPTIQDSRVEIFLQLCLHLVQLAVSEDNSVEGSEDNDSFILHALDKQANGGSGSEGENGDHGNKTIAAVLHRLASLEEFKACWPKINNVLRRMRQKKQAAFDAVAAWAHEMGEKMDTETEQASKEAEAEKRKQLAKERQAKIMAQMRQQQQNFMASVDFKFDEDSEDEPEDADLTEGEQKTLWKYPTGTCILCQEETNDSRLYGTLGLITNSNILRQTDLEDRDYVYEVLKMPDSLDRSAQDIRPYGVASLNRDKVTKLAPDGSELGIERQGLGRGFPAHQVRRGPISIGCSHIMHFSCFEHYHDSTRRRHPHQIARHHPEKLELKEFVCPLCKALGNAFLPIIWKTKEETQTGVLQPATQFHSWLNEQIGPTVSRLEKVVEFGDGQDAVVLSKYQDMFFEYGANTMVSSVATKLQNLSVIKKITLPLSIGPANAIRSAVATIIQPAIQPAVQPANQVARPPMGIAAPSATTPLPIQEELQSIYRRLRNTLRVNDIQTRYTSVIKPWEDTDPDLTHCDALASCLGFSISAVEIAQRGVESEPGSTLLDNLSQQTLTYLRIFSETVCSYMAVGSLQSRDNNNQTILQFRDMQRRQIQKLFVGHPQIYDDNVTCKTVAPLMCNDVFLFLAECSVCMVPAMGLEIMHILQLCYIAEVVKTVLGIMTSGKLKNMIEEWNHTGRLENLEGSIGCTEKQIESFEKFVIFIESFYPVGEFRHMNSFQSRAIVSKYVTPFLRKCVILLHTRYGVIFPNTGYVSMEESEQDRICSALRLPKLDEIFESCVEKGSFLGKMIEGWCSHIIIQKNMWGTLINKTKLPEPKVSLSHPAIFELVGLPLHFDTLVEEAMKRKCPNTGKDLVEPSVCLFCGEIFCSQAFCCQDEAGLGGCNKHMKKCAVNVGIFINIRKCCVLFLHHGHGSFAVAPYLDRHGETDWGLRRNRRLFLNQRRYDALLRTVWLQHGIPSVISRKLEADINNGGWETL
ncbi:E3 ubiquitin-protein ligase ubr1 [Rhizina undulata]